MAKLTLYLSPGSSSMAPHIALREVGADFEARPTLLATGDNKTPAYLAINPEGKVPTLLVDDRPMTEVAAILFYIAKSFPKAGLLPEGVEGEAQAIAWMSFVASTVHPARPRGLEAVHEVLGVAERRLGGREWALGAYSIADIHLFRVVWRFQGLFNLDLGEFPGLSSHYDRMMKRPALIRTLEAEAAMG